MSGFITMMFGRLTKNAKQDIAISGENIKVDICIGQKNSSPHLCSFGESIFTIKNGIISKFTYFFTL